MKEKENIKPLMRKKLKSIIAVCTVITVTICLMIDIVTYIILNLIMKPPGVSLSDFGKVVLESYKEFIVNINGVQAIAYYIIVTIIIWTIIYYKIDKENTTKSIPEEEIKPLVKIATLYIIIQMMIVFILCAIIQTTVQIWVFFPKYYISLLEAGLITLIMCKFILIPLLNKKIKKIHEKETKNEENNKNIINNNI